MTDADAILDATVDELHRASGFHLCEAIRIEGDEVVSAAARGTPVDEDLAWGWRAPRDAGVIGRCLREVRVVRVDDVTSDPDYLDSPITTDVRSELVAPLHVGDDLLGAINIEETMPGAFDDEDVEIVGTVAEQVAAALLGARMYAQLEEAYLSTTEALAAAMEFGDPAPSERAAAIVEYADAVGRNLGLSDGELRDLRLGAILHDIGKVAVPDSILAKREPLSDSERRIVQQHATVSEQILSPVAFLAPVRPLVRHGHERWDGRGYPDGLRGEQIPLGARIILACDAYTAMTVERPYRRAMTHSEAIAELRRHAGRQFDLRVIDALVAVLDRERVQA
jgi:response regulator RpfG family c-di-GMP phosphodiesterase